MPFDLASSADDLEAYLTSKVPATWKVADAGKLTGGTVGVVLTYTQGDVRTSLGSNDIPPGAIVIDYALILSVPETDPVKGLAHINGELHHLINALDADSQLDWTTAERGVLPSGETIYLIPIQVIATYDTQE